MPKNNKAPGPKSDKIWADAVRKAVHSYHEVKGEDGSVEKIRNLNALATNLVAMARKGDMSAMKEIGDRLDGKPHQSQTHDVTMRRQEDALDDLE